MRIVTWAAILVQAYIIYAFVTRSFAWPIMWPSARIVFIVGTVVFYSAYTVMNGVLAAELKRKTELESDQRAARKIQRMLIPEDLPPLPNYEMETYYQPFREVGGDYFDVIALAEPHTLIALADVSGKGMAAALLSANIQALVRSMSTAGAQPVALAKQINLHLCRHTPSESMATAVFLLLNRESGELTYVNAGHNAPIIFGDAGIKLLPATGLPLGLFANAEYEAGTVSLDVGDSLLLFTDGLTDSMIGVDPEARICSTLAGKRNVKETMVKLRSLIDERLNRDDVTIVLVSRLPLSPATAGEK